MSLSRLGAMLAVLSALALISADFADARVGRGGSFGSRGSRTFSAPPPTNTAPKTAAPMEKSMTPATSPAAGQPAVGTQRPSMFGGLRGILLGGLIAAGLASIFGFGALASILGFVLQMVLIAGLVWLAMAFFRSRRTGEPALARAQATGGPARAPDIRLPGGVGGYAPKGAAYGSAPPQNGSALAIGQSDLDTFERMLGEIQTAYSREDTRRLGDMTTPEMLSYFSQELADNARQGVRNEVSGVELLQGDVAEAWREPGTDYATVAMRYRLRDVMVDRKTGKVVSGDPHRDEEATELWTFRRDDRDRTAGWQLSAIQQA